ncbi:unnamed protein product, partial [Medioppia subpectinata]
MPAVFINDIDLAREVFRKTDFAGRPASSYTSTLFSNDEYTDIVFADFGHKWEALRRVAHSAVQKYAASDKLMYTAADCVDYTIKTIVDREGIDKPFNPIPYIHHMLVNILSASAFNK